MKSGIRDFSVETPYKKQC